MLGSELYSRSAGKTCELQEEFLMNRHASADEQWSSNNPKPMAGRGASSRQDRTRRIDTPDAGT